MGEFFKGWRRKAGLVTLAMALLLTVAWMRSCVTSDVIISHSQMPSTSFESCDGGLCCFQWTDTSTAAQHRTSRQTLYFIPYWSLVLPLTLLSAWLLLVKPRKAKAATGSTP